MERAFSLRRQASTRLKRLVSSSSRRSLREFTSITKHKLTRSNASSPSLLSSLYSPDHQQQHQQELRLSPVCVNSNQLYLVLFHRKATKVQVEQAKRLIMERGGLVREISILPYHIKATMRDNTVVKDLYGLKGVKRVDAMMDYS